MTRYKELKSQTGFEIAIIGMGCRFPDADNPDEFWENLLAEKESITFFDKKDIAEQVPAEFLVDDKSYIPASGYLDKPDYFDGAFFDFSNKEALLLDPQIRLFLECSWAALEESGYADKVDQYRAGVFGTASDNLLWQMVTSSTSSKLLSEYYQASILNNKDFLSTIASYKLNLTGASLNLSTACSSSLVAVHLACQSLLSGTIDLGIAGGVCINFPFKQGYVYQDGMILSKDGHCRSFDMDASGTVGGNGGGVVLLKRLDQALEDNDYIYAVIKGSAVNNDGIRKIGFTAPSIDGQAEVISNAHYMAEIDPESIGYVEAHGSGTQIGDQIEIEALKKAFDTKTKNYCAVGSVKSNIGHLDTAAGIAGLIKAALSLKHKKLIRSLNYNKPNKGINFEESPFYVNDITRDFVPVGNNPLRAGISSFGISGTNAHVVLEERPEEYDRFNRAEEEDVQLLLLSAKTVNSLENIAGSYKHYFENNEFDLCDAGHTTRVGRKHFNLRRCVVCRNKSEATERLEAASLISNSREIKYAEKERRIYLLFSTEGQNIADNSSAQNQYAARLEEYTGVVCEHIASHQWDAFLQRIQEEQDAVSVIVEVGNTASFQPVFDDLSKQNDRMEYIHLASELDEAMNEQPFLLQTIGSLWEVGLEVLWEKVYAGKEHYIIPLPTYAFDKTQYTLKLDSINLGGQKIENASSEHHPLMFERTWNSSSMASVAATGIAGDTIVLFADQSELRESLMATIGEWGQDLIVVTRGDSFYKVSDKKYVICEDNFEDYVQLLYLLEKEKRNVFTYIHLFSMTEKPAAGSDDDPCGQFAYRGYYDLLHLARALGYIETSNKNKKNLFVISNNLLSVSGSEEIIVDKAGLIGPIRNISVEFPLIQLKYIDFDLFSATQNDKLIARQISEEIIRPEAGCLIAYRGRKRYVESFKQIEFQQELPDFSTGERGWSILFCEDDTLHESDLAPVYSSMSGLTEGKLTLVSRLPLTDMRAVEKLKGNGIEVEYIQCDYYNQNELDSLLAAIPRNSIDGIFCMGLVKEDEYPRFILEANEQQREMDYLSVKWTFVLNLFNGIKDLEYKFVMFCLPGVLYSGKEGNSLGAGLVHAINGLCVYADYSHLRKWYTYFSYPVSAGQNHSIPYPPLSFSGSSTEMIFAQQHPREILEDSRKSYDELFQLFLDRKRPIEDVFYKPSWIQRKNINIRLDFEEKVCVLFAGSSDKGQMLEQAFSSRFKNLIVVWEGEAFSRSDIRTYYIDSSKLEDYYELFDNIQAETGLPDIIIHGYNFNDSSLFATKSLNKDLDRGLYSLINIARAMGRFESVTKTTICSITNNIIKIDDADTINPGKAPCLAAVKVIPFEYPSLSCLNLDIDVEKEKELTDILDSILIDIALAGDYFTVLSYRKGRRYIERFEQCHPMPEKSWKPLLKDKGIYLITGGFGGMGFSIASFLAKTYRARCVLVGRSPFPPAEKWESYSGEDKKTAKFIQKILELEAHGAEILVVPTDITDKEQVNALANKIEERWQAPLNGIIHTAGLVDYNGIIQNRPREKTAEAAAPKIEGTLNLDQVFNHHHLDFFVLCSSIGDIIPASKVGEVGYSVGNEFLDAYTHYKGDKGEKFITINWNDWSEVGMSVDSHHKRFEGKDFVPAFDEPIATKPEEGVAAFNHVLHMNQRRLVIAPYDLSALILKDVEMNYIRMTKNVLNSEEAGRMKSGHKEPELLSKTEAKMLDIYRDLFETDDIKIEDNFFDIGGDSLMAMSILSYIHAHFDVKLPVDKFFNQPTIREVAGTIDSLTKKKFTTITKAEPKPVYALSPAQERMFVTDQIYKEMALTTYNEPHMVTLKGKVDINRVERTFRKIIERHESFRTSYHFNNKVPVQKIHETVDFKVEVLDVDRTSVESVIRGFIKPFDLATPPLVRAGLMRIEEGEWILVIDKHHITCDGLSNQILFQNFAELYDGADLPVQALQYVDFSEWYNHTYRESMQDENEKFWLDLFKDGVPELKLPYDHRKTPAAMFQGALLDFEFTSEQWDKWRSVFSGKDTTQFVIILAIYSLMLAKITGQKDFVIGSPVSGRWHKDVNSIVGMFVNMLSFRTRLGEENTFLDFLKIQKKHYLGVLENQYYPFDLLVKKVVKKRDYLENPIFNVSLEQHAFNDASNDSEDKVKDFTLGLYQLPSEYITSRFDLSLLFGEKEDRLAFRFIYARELFDQSTIEEYRNCFMDMIEKILENPAVQLSALLVPDVPRLPGISKQESRQVVSYADASSHQERLWFIDSFEANKLYEGSPVYHNIPALVPLDFVPDIPVLQKAVDTVFNKYDALCTAVHIRSHKPIQVVSKPALFPIEVRSTQFEESNKDELLALANREARIPFVLEEWPLIRVILLENSHNRSVLLIVAHHIICDNYSLQLLLRELVDAYHAGGTVKDGTVHLQYSDYSHWQASIPGNVKKQLLTFWENTLREVKPLELYTDFPRKDIHVYEAGFRTFTLPEGIVEKVIEWKGLNNVDTATLLMAGFKALLYRYSGAENITIGTMRDNRNKVQGDSIIGPLAGLVTVSADITPGMTFEDLVKAVAHFMERCEPYTDIPFEPIVSHINPRKDMSRTALFDILFRYSDRSGYTEALKFLDTNLGLGKYDLNLFMEKTDSSFEGTLTYNALYYSSTTIDHLVQHFIVLLDELFTDPQKDLLAYPIIKGEVKEAMLKLQQSNKSVYPGELTLFEAFQRQVNRTPDKAALTYNGRSMSYRELEQHSINLSNYLLETYNVESGEVVALLMSNSEWMIVAMLAVLRSGACYLPINTENPEDRVKYLIGDSKSRLLITDQNIGQEMEYDREFRVLHITGYTENRPEVAYRPAPLLQQNTPAYVIYTSGTTGEPKGCLVTHSNVIRLILNSDLPFNFDESDKWVMAHAYSFDFSVWEIFGSLFTGGELVIPSVEEVRNVEQFVNIVKSNKITVLNQTPGAFLAFMLVEKKLGEPELQRHLRYVLFGGAKLEPYLLKDWIDRYSLDEIVLCNLYGITETTVHTTYYFLQENEIVESKAVSNIGGPLPETAVYILNDKLELVPRGVIGEIYVGGSGVSAGYLNRPELNKKAFIVNPFHPEEILYKSGDLGRWISEKEIQYLGRKDRQVKIRGYRIELGEIESRLLDYPGINQVHIAQHRENEKLCAYIEADKQLDAEDLKNYLSRRLPEYMVPTFFMQIEKIPLNRNNKVDAQALPLPEEHYASNTKMVLPRNETEEKIIAIVKELLKIEKISVLDNYFDLGVDSLMLIQMNSRIQEELGMRLPLMELFKHTSISQLGYYIANQGSSYEFNEEKAKQMAGHVSNLSTIRKRLKDKQEEL
ncbi:amino acid adenylation domain-containing protein [Paenibacillus amylolyticus]|uniref:amino acid adenylation domain-containing protein n=1 Tax=Paenibacillus amylolyticus TaxID=1451 RepID=UPI003EB7090C